MSTVFPIFFCFIRRRTQPLIFPLLLQPAAQTAPSQRGPFPCFGPGRPPSQRESLWHVGQVPTERAKHDVSETVVLRCLGQRQLDKVRCPEAAQQGRGKALFLPKTARKKKSGINTKKFAKTVDIRLQSGYYITVARPSWG